MDKHGRYNKIACLEKQAEVLEKEIELLADEFKSMENSLLILQQAGKDDDDGLLQDVAKKLSTFNQQLNTKKQILSSVESEIRQLKQKNSQIHPVVGYCLLISIFIIPYFLFEYLPEWVFLIIGILALLFCGKSGGNRPDKGAFYD